MTADFMLHRFNSVIANLVVYPENMMKNLNLTGGLVFSQRVLLELPLKGVSREDAYRIVQRNAMKVWEGLQQGKSAINRITSYNVCYTKLLRTHRGGNVHIY